MTGRATSERISSSIYSTNLVKVVSQCKILAHREDVTLQQLNQDEQV